MATVRTLITEALITAGVQDPVETPTAEQIARALWQFQNLCEAWDLEGLWPYVGKTTTGTFVAGTDSYTVGTGGDIAIARPNRIKALTISDGAVQWALEEVSQRDIANQDRIDGMQSQPSFFAYITDYPLASIKLYNTPSVNYDFTLTYEAVSPSYGLDDSLDLPAGYTGALEYGLAVILADRYGIDLSPAIRQEAVDRKTRIKQFNYQPSVITPTFQTRRGPTNILTNR